MSDLSTKEAAERDARLERFAAFVARDRKLVPRLRGLNPVAALSASYNQRVDLLRAAAEYGARPQTFVGILSEWIASGDMTARALSLGAIERSAFDHWLLQTQVPRKAAKPQTKPLLVIWPAKERYAPGGAIQLFVKTTRSCWPTVVSVDATGRALLLYPNGFADHAQLRAGMRLAIPADGAPYTLRANALGEERVLAFCAPTAAPVFANDLDFERQVFASLGDWDAFLKTSSARYRKALNAAALSDRRARWERQTAAIKRRNRRRSRRRQIIPPKPIVDRRPPVMSRAAAAYTVTTEALVSP